MVRGDSQKHLAKLNELPCDVATINLEDGISDKKAALELTKEAISTLKVPFAKIAIRVNGLDNGGLLEMEELEKFSFDAFRIPKIKSTKELEVVSTLTKRDIYATIETKEAFTGLKELLSYGAIKVAYLGILDLLSDLKLPQSMLLQNNKTINYIMSEFVVTCRAFNVTPISFTYQDYKDLDGFREWCELSKSMGFEGMGCISPSQVGVANDVFLSSSQELERAKYIKNIFEEHIARGVSGFSDERYGFIDEPIYRDALNILKKCP